MMISKNDVIKLRNDSAEYNRAIDDILQLFEERAKTCRIVHKQSGLYFNGYDYNFSKGKNTLSLTNFATIMCLKRTDSEIIKKVFDGHILNRNGLQLIKNNIVYAGSEVAKILSKSYIEIDYLPLEDFVVERDLKSKNNKISYLF